MFEALIAEVDGLIAEATELQNEGRWAEAEYLIDKADALTDEAERIAA